MSKRVTQWCDFPLWYPNAEDRIQVTGIKPLMAAQRWDVMRIKPYHDRAPFITMLIGAPRCTLCGGKIREGQQIISSIRGVIHADHFLDDYVVDRSRPGDFACGVQ